jgi:L-alanine-DL-glutamate epimerase-like enolase superfamily enzyme
VSQRIKIQAVDSAYECEPLIRPFGFKGGYLTRVWQTAVRLQSDSVKDAIGLGTQSVLWSDAAVFAAHSEEDGNGLMYRLTQRALELARSTTFDTPLALFERLFDPVYQHGREITGNPRLRKTFALNALVPVDNAAWLLYARVHGISQFDNFIPARYRPALAHRHEKLASIPLMAYAVPIEEIVEAVQCGYFFLKIKIGQPGSQEEMLEKDKARITAIHEAIGRTTTPHTRDGKLPYYFDANGRYESKDTLLQLIEHLRRIGALDQVALIEEPFPEEFEADVRDIPVRLAADESAHTDQDAIRRCEMGYGALALKPIAKTLSLTLKIAQAAHERNVPCFCADLTVHPILVDWNKNVAARLAPFPGLSVGLLETNGHQNYQRWPEMTRQHPCHRASWTQTHQGLFELSDDFYKQSGGIFLPSQHFESLFAKPRRDPTGQPTRRPA